MRTEACECGSAIHLGEKVDGTHDESVWLLWQHLHRAHERVTMGECRKLRDNAKKRRREGRD